MPKSRLLYSLLVTPMVTGENTNIDGSPGNPAEDVTGMLIATPGTVAHLLTEITADELDHVDGLGGMPSLGVTSPMDLPTIVAQAKNAADIVLTSNEYSSLDFGNASAGTANITYREGDVKFTGNTRGAGMLVVTGRLEMVDNFRFDGVIVGSNLGEQVGHGSRCGFRRSRSERCARRASARPR